jgi:signal transduction histidine kinase
LIKQTIIFFCLIFLIIGGQAQQPNPSDSLKNLLKTASGTKKVDILNNLGWEFKYENTFEAFKYSGEAYKLAGTIKYSRGMAESARNLSALNLLTNHSKEAQSYANEGILYATAISDTFTLAKLYNLKALVLEDKYQYSQAIWYFNKSYQLFSKIRNQNEKAGILNNLAVLYGQINEKKLELETYIKVIGLEEKANNKVGIARTYNNMAGVYSDMGNKKTALELYRKSLFISHQTSTSRFEAAALNGIGLIKRDLKQYDSSIYYIDKASVLNMENGYSQWLANNYLNLGDIYLQDLHDEEMGSPYINKAISIFHTINDWNGFISAINAKIDWYLQQKQLSEVGKMFSEGDLLIDSIASDQVRRDYLFLKYKFNKESGHSSDALSLLEQVTILDDTINVRQRAQESYELQAKYDLVRQQQLNDRLKMKNNLDIETIRNQKIAVVAALIICLLLFLIVILSLKSKRKISKANQALNDVTHQIFEKAAELQLANESKDKFLSIISHDLKNPINAITGLSDLLMDKSMDLNEEDRYMYLKYINDGCLSADQLLENLMKWVRSQTGNMEMNPKEFDLSQPVANAIALVNNAAFRKGIRISSEVQEGTIVYADFEMISTCLINLLSNAVKFTPGKGNISLHQEVYDDKVMISVSDTGVGISTENISKLFRLDTRAGTLGTENEKGTGLGLLLVKEFIEKNNGSVQVESNLGMGSTFTLSVPRNPSGTTSRMEKAV